MKYREFMAQAKRKRRHRNTASGRRLWVSSPTWLVDCCSPLLLWCERVLMRDQTGNVLPISTGRPTTNAAFPFRQDRDGNPSKTIL
jgi:hypothetical protein